MEDVIRFAGRDWLVTEATKSTLVIRSVNTIARLCWHECAYEVVNWSDCSLRKYLNRNFYQSIPEENRARIIPVINTTNTRKMDNFETTEDHVWLETIENIGSFIHERNRIETWLRNPCVDNTCHAWLVSSDGFPYDPWPMDVYGVRPSMRIKRE